MWQHRQVHSRSLHCNWTVLPPGSREKQHCQHGSCWAQTKANEAKLAVNCCPAKAFYQCPDKCSLWSWRNGCYGIIFQSVKCTRHDQNNRESNFLKLEQVRLAFSHGHVVGAIATIWSVVQPSDWLHEKPVIFRVTTVTVCLECRPSLVLFTERIFMHFASGHSLDKVRQDCRTTFLQCRRHFATCSIFGLAWKSDCYLPVTADLRAPALGWCLLITQTDIHSFQSDFKYIKH